MRIDDNSPRFVLASSLLDPVLHPLGKAEVILDDPDASVSRGGGVTPSPFQAGSIGEYLRTQARLREIIETKMTEDRDVCVSEGKFRRGGVWKHVRVTYVMFEPRKVRTRAGLRRMGKAFPGMRMDESLIDHLMAHSDTPRTRATFSVIVDTPWDREHQVRNIVFRDGEVAEFRVGY